jgi:V/A-type H+-transporting ATPase subunit A
VVGAFHGLSSDRANARRFPSIDPHESWSKYPGFIDPAQLESVKSVMSGGKESGQMMKVVGEEGVSLSDYVVYLKSEFLDQVYLQQNAFDPVEGVTALERQNHVFGTLGEILAMNMVFLDKSRAFQFFQNLRHAFVNWNYKPWGSEAFNEAEAEIYHMLDEVSEVGKDAKGL